MTPLIAGLHWVGYGAALLPLALCLALWKRRSLPGEAWLVACAFAISFVMDTVNRQLALAHIPNAWVGYIGYPLQFAALFWAVAKDKPARWVSLIGLALISMSCSALPVSFWVALRLDELPKDVMIRAAGAIGICLLLLESHFPKKFRHPVLLYAVGCLPFIVAKAVIPTSDSLWVWAWGGHRATMIVALGWMAFAVWSRRSVLRVDHPSFHERQTVRPQESAA